MKNDPAKEVMANAVRHLVSKAAKTDDANDALKFSQAARNAANAMCALNAAMEGRENDHA